VGVQLRKCSPVEAWERSKKLLDTMKPEDGAAMAVLLVVAGNRLAEELKKVKRFNRLSHEREMEWPRA